MPISPTPIVRIPLSPRFARRPRRRPPIQIFHTRHRLEYLFYLSRPAEHSSGERRRRARTRENDERPGASEPPESFDAFQRRLIEIEPRLPKRLRQAAAYALEHPDEFALGTASALARNAEVQASTLVRFAQTLGFAGFSELQALFRSRLRNRWPDYSERLRALQQNARDSGDPIDLLFGFANSAAASIARLREVAQARA